MSSRPLLRHDPRRRYHSRCRHLSIQPLEARCLLASDLSEGQRHLPGELLSIDSLLADTSTLDPASRLRAVKETASGKLGGLLGSIAAEYSTNAAKSIDPSALPHFYSNLSNEVRVHDGKVIIDAVASSDADHLASDLTALGSVVTGTFEQLVSAWVPLDALSQVAELDSLLTARASMARTNGGLVTSEADLVHNVEASRFEFEVDGTGIPIGVMSDTFDNDGDPFTGMFDDMISGDLPFDVTILEEGFDQGNDEGRAMAQLIHDLAPGSPILYNSAFNGVGAFVNGINDLANAGAQVIVDDISYFASPMYMDGPIARAVDFAVAGGVSYFSSAGNLGRQGWEDRGGFSAATDPETGLDFHDFDPGPEIDLYQQIEIPIDTQVLFILQWDQAFRSAGTPGATGDVDVYLTNGGTPTVNNILAGSIDFNVGLDPVEIFAFYNDGSFDLDGEEGPDTEFSLFFHLFEGLAPGRLKYVYYEFGDAIDIEYATNSGTIYGHANAARANSVGAAFYGETPVFGTDPAELESFSSAGGQEILLTPQGFPLSRPTVRSSPDFVAADGTNNTFFGSDVEGDGFPNFFGTSASAPHAAAIAALLIEASGGLGKLSPTALTTLLKSTSIDMLTPGVDQDSGTGLIDAYEALSQISTPSTHDFGDAPASYGVTLGSNGARHYSIGPTLGTSRDKEPDGIPSDDASSDDISKTDDENGIQLLSSVVIGGALELSVQTPSGGFLNAWIDFNRNGRFEAAEKIMADRRATPGTQRYSIAIPGNALPGNSFARFRITANSGQATTANGPAPNGEVEDFPLVIRRVLPGYIPNSEVINGSAANTNRSGLGALQLKFDQPMIVSNPLALRLVNRTTNQVINLSGPTGPLVSLRGNGTQAITWEFAPAMASRITNGRYTFELAASDARSLDNSPLTSTAAGTFHIIRGDLNADTRVDAADVNIARSYQSLTVGSRYRMGDASGDGYVTVSDTALVSGSLNDTTLPALGLDFGDAVESGTTFPTKLARNGARSAVVTGPRFGSQIDAEIDGQPNSFAIGDGTDEDGATIALNSLQTQINGTVRVTATSAVYVNGWIDLNGDGDWLDSGEQFLRDRLTNSGSFSFNIPVTMPSTRIDAYIRLRVTTLSGYSFHSFSGDGEVEDYLVILEPTVGGSQGLLAGSTRGTDGRIGEVSKGNSGSDAQGSTRIDSSRELSPSNALTHPVASGHMVTIASSNVNDQRPANQATRSKKSTLLATDQWFESLGKGWID